MDDKQATSLRDAWLNVLEAVERMDKVLAMSDKEVAEEANEPHWYTEKI